MSLQRWDSRLVSELDHWLRMERTAKDQQRRLVTTLREQGCPWSIIGQALNTSRQNAQQRFSPRSGRADEADSR